MASQENKGANKVKEYSVSGLVATAPRHLVTQEGLAITSFRLAEHDSNDPNSITNWYTVTAFKQMAVNAAMSITKGDRVVAIGMLKVRDWDNGERSGTSVEIEATALGHDLEWGTTEFKRTQPTPVSMAHECSCDNCPNK
jgi:single-strand DNA-binding protein